MQRKNVPTAETIGLEELVEDAHYLLTNLGLDPKNDPHLIETPRRFAKAMQFWTSGYGQDPKSVLKEFPAEGEQGIVFQANIPVYSLCAHHMAPFFGVAHVAYLPNQKVVGLSKLARLVDIYARRLQVQEKLCSQVADSLMNNLDCKGSAVVLQCRHLCMESRGVQKPGTVTLTSALRGDFFNDPTLRAEFMALVSVATQGLKHV